MSSRRRPRNATLLIVMLLLGVVYLVLLTNLQPLFAAFKTDGIVSVLFGLFLCSHPVANVLDVLLFRRYLLQPKGSGGLEILWWALNGVVLFTGWYIIFIGMLRFSVPST